MVKRLDPEEKEARKQARAAEAAAKKAEQELAQAELAAQEAAAADDADKEEVPAFLRKSIADRPAGSEPAPEAAKQPDVVPRATDTEGRGSNSSELTEFVERLERLAEEKQGIADGMKEVVAEAKARGFDTAIMRKVIARRKMDRDERREMDALIETYENELGM